ncbi:MAG TPA: hypothetical protein VF194_02745 [Ferrovibrio sp.]|uniref:hypothetical protein n=1 Tax=Ferrovibrio sp. TaxID=1917215 RepID=UPI002ED66D5C
MNAFLDALQAQGPADDCGGKMALYAWLIGSWEIDTVETAPDGDVRRRIGEWHFGWALEGRAIQDVWIVPKRGARHAADAVADAAYYGTTLRVYDPRIDAWHIRWTDPVAQAYLSQIGRKEGDAIVQEGKDALGKSRRWSFTEIAPDSFLWRGEVSEDGGTTWFTHMEFRARRTAG